MSGQELMLLDIDGLVHKLNSALAEREGRIIKGSFIEMQPQKQSFIYRWQDREMETVGKYPLTQNNSRGLYGLMGEESSRSIGYIFVETGAADVSSDYGGSYETLRLRIKYPLQLRNGLIIPKSSVKLYAEANDEWAGVDSERRDHIRKAGLVWIKADLENVLPKEWFLNRRL